MAELILLGGGGHARSILAHPTAVVDAGAELGAGALVVGVPASPVRTEKEERT